MIWSAVGGLLSVLSKAVGGFFGLKESQGKIIEKALEVVSDVNTSDDARAVAAAKIISSEAHSDSWITRSWRPLTVVALVTILISHYLGYTMPNLNEDSIRWLQDMVEYSVLGYMGMRSADKWVRDLSLAKVLRTFIEKKLG